MQELSAANHRTLFRRVNALADVATLGTLRAACAVVDYTCLQLSTRPGGVQKAPATKRLVSARAWPGHAACFAAPPCAWAVCRVISCIGVLALDVGWVAQDRCDFLEQGREATFLPDRPSM